MGVEHAPADWRNYEHPPSRAQQASMPAGPYRSAGTGTSGGFACSRFFCRNLESLENFEALLTDDAGAVCCSHQSDQLRSAMGAKRSSTKQSTNEAKSDLAVSYDEFKEHEASDIRG